MNFRFCLSLAISLAISLFLFHLNFSIFKISNKISNETSNERDGERHDQLQIMNRPKIAIIGGGAAGSSATFFLSHLSSSIETLPSIEITLFERRPYIGGRSTVIIPFLNSSELPENLEKDEKDLIELGASIFVKANKNLWKASEVFGLERIEGLGEVDGKSAIWNGEEILFMFNGSWMDSAKAFWRYGISPIRVKSFTSKVIKAFETLYTQKFTTLGPFPTISSFLLRPPLSTDNLFPSLISQSFFSWITSRIKGYGLETFINEIVGVSCSVNYGTSSHVIDGLGGFASLASEGAVRIKGGNRKIFSKFLEISQKLLNHHQEKKSLEIKLENSVSRIQKVKDLNGKFLGWNLTYSSPSTTTTRHTPDTRYAFDTQHPFDTQDTQTIGNEKHEFFDAVILACPIQLLDPMIEFDFGELDENLNENSSKIEGGIKKGFELVPPMNFVHLHVTMVITNSSNPDKSFFGLEKDQQGPLNVYATFDALKDENKDSSKILDFHSLTYLRQLKKKKNKDQEEILNHEDQNLFIVKFFSLRELSDEKISQVFGGPENIFWTLRKEWNVYPKLTPIKDSKDFADFRLAERLYYPSAFERLISTMETATVSAENSVSLLVQDLFGYTKRTSWVEWDL